MSWLRTQALHFYVGKQNQILSCMLNFELRSAQTYFPFSLYMHLLTVNTGKDGARVDFRSLDRLPADPK